jgi:hypothetical protein
MSRNEIKGVRNCGVVSNDCRFILQVTSTDGLNLIHSNIVRDLIKTREQIVQQTHLIEHGPLEVGKSNTT